MPVLSRILPRRRPKKPAVRHSFIEPLESRIAPATLVNPMTVTYQDLNGDSVTISISKPLFTASNVNKVFTFDTGSVNGVNTTDQQLQLFNVTKLGSAASGMDISITSVLGINPGVTNVGYINASGIALGNVTVGGDLGRIAAGNFVHGIQSLTVDSFGVQGLGTQQPVGANLNTLIAGSVGSITVNGDIDGASIGVGGGAHGVLGSLTITGNINGGTADYSGSVRTQGGITNVLVDGAINGGMGYDSGVIGTAGTMGTVVIEGSLNGGNGSFSGAILSTKPMQSVQIDGSINGGVGMDSGQVGSASSLGSVTVEGSVFGGNGPLSGVILATGNITSVTIDNGLIGGNGASSGEIGSGHNIGTVTVGTPEVLILPQKTAVATPAEPAPFQGVEGGPGPSSGAIVAQGTINSVTIYGYLEGYFSDGIIHKALAALAPVAASGAVTAGGSIQSIDVTLGLDYAYVWSGGSIGSFTSGGQVWESTVQAHQNIGSISVTGEEVTIVSPILNPLVANAPNEGYFADAIEYSGFDAGGNIGALSIDGSIYGSVFIAGIDLGAGFNTFGAGTFNNSDNFGYGHSSSTVPAHIGAITLTGYDSLIEASTFLAGVHGQGLDKMFGTNDDSVPTGSSIGAITSPGGLNDCWFESGSIGATTTGEIVNTTYIATDTAVSAGGIGAITVTGTIVDFDYVMPAVIGNPNSGISSDSSHGIFDSTFISNAGIGPVNVTLNGTRNDSENAAISSSLFQAGHAIGSITVTDNAYGSNGSNYGIVNSTFNGGLNGYGGAGDISVTLTDTGPDGNSAAIADCDFDATVCACMSANMGSIYAENADTSQTAAGIVDSVFRVHGNIGPIGATMDSGSVTAPAIEGTIFSAYGSIGDINVYGAVTSDNNGSSMFLAGYDVGSDMTFGNEDLSATSVALHTGQSVGDVSVSGYFQGSDIIASVNPGAGYVFGADNNANVGSGGSIGTVALGTNVTGASNPFISDQAESFGIEAATFVGESPTVSVYGFTSGIPIVLSFGDAPGSVRITNFTEVG
ncbi:MAG: hypothetical protein ABSE62_06145 [Chthoniobacteraceae bacterium]